MGTRFRNLLYSLLSQIGLVHNKCKEHKLRKGSNLSCNIKYEKKTFVIYKLRNEMSACRQN